MADVPLPKLPKLPDLPIDPAACPLCGADNRCAMEVEKATGEPQPPCWCVAASFPPELLERLPTEAQGTACICANCLARFAGET